MRAALVYSGWLRSYDQCKQNHKEMIIADEFTEFHRNETMCELHWHTVDIERYNENRVPETKVRHTMNQWHNMYCAFANCQASDAEVFVRIRYDILLTGQIRLSDYELRDNVVYIPFGNDYRDGVNDQLAFGNYEAMKKYYSVFLNHWDIFNSGVTFHTESYLTLNLKNLGVEIKRIEVETKIVRPENYISLE